MSVEIAEMLSCIFTGIYAWWLIFKPMRLLYTVDSRYLELAYLE